MIKKLKKSFFYADAISEYTMPFDNLIDEILCEEYESVLNIERYAHGKGTEMWCHEHSTFDIDCGKNKCDSYNPKNGKSGCCRYLTNSLIGTGEYFMFKRVDKEIWVMPSSLGLRDKNWNWTYAIKIN